jgi:hypothetical protein
MLADEIHEKGVLIAQRTDATGQISSLYSLKRREPVTDSEERPGHASANKRQRPHFRELNLGETDKIGRQPSIEPEVLEVETGAKAPVSEAATGEKPQPQAPSWCDRPLVTRADYPEDAQVGCVHG